MSAIDISDYFAVIPEELEEALAFLVSKDEGKRLLNQTNEKVGSISIEIINDSESFTSSQKIFWSWGKKTIEISRELIDSSSECELVCYLVFEIFNALKTDEYKNLINEGVSVVETVGKLEFLEHQSALETKNFALRFFRDNAPLRFLNIFEDFRVHYALQQISGHSEWLAKNYFPDQEYPGTLNCKLSELNDEERKILRSILKYYSKKDKTDYSKTITLIAELKEDNESYQKIYSCAINLLGE